jgi:predicted permease
VHCAVVGSTERRDGLHHPPPLQNAGNLPLSLIISITRDIEPFASDPTATSRGVAYTSITMTYLSLMCWSVAYNYLRPSSPPLPSRLPIGADDTTDDSDAGPLAYGQLKKLDAATDAGRRSAAEQDTSGDDKKAVAASALPWKRLAKELFTPVTIALAIALVVGLVRPLRR